MTSPGAFLIYSKFYVLGCSEGKKEKKAQYEKKLFLSQCASGTLHHMTVIFDTHV